MSRLLVETAIRLANSRQYALVGWGYPITPCHEYGGRWSRKLRKIRKQRRLACEAPHD